MLAQISTVFSTLKPSLSCFVEIELTEIPTELQSVDFMRFVKQIIEDMYRCEHPMTFSYNAATIILIKLAKYEYKVKPKNDDQFKYSYTCY